MSATRPDVFEIDLRPHRIDYVHACDSAHTHVYSEHEALDNFIVVRLTCNDNIVVFQRVVATSGPAIRAAWLRTPQAARRRPTADEVWLNVARDVGQRSACARAREGCVIVDAAGRVTATGYNGPPSGWSATVPVWLIEDPGARVDMNDCSTWCPRARAGELNLGRDTEYRDCPSLHAEANALIWSDRTRHEGGVAYVTGVPCHGCAKLLANSGLSRVVYAVRPYDHAERDVAGIAEFLRACGVELETIETEDNPT